MSEKIDCVGYGTLSASWIGGKEVQAIMRSKYARLVAVSSRSQEKLDNFIKQNGIDVNKVKGYTSYDDVIQNEEVEVVYISVPTTLRLGYVKKVANAGKHVIVEKPYQSAEEVREMIEVCKKNGVMIMDNTMFLHHLRTKEVEEKYLTEEGRSKLKRVHAVFTYHFPVYDNIRYNTRMEPDGALGDMGWYCVQGTLFGFGELPVEVMAMCGKHEPTGAINNCQAMLRFKNNRFATLSTSFNETSAQRLDYTFDGELMVSIPNFVLPIKSDILLMENKDKVEFGYTEKTHYYVREPKSGMMQKQETTGECYQVVCLIDNYSQWVREKKFEKAGLMMERSHNCMVVIDAIRKSMTENVVVKVE